MVVDKRHFNISVVFSYHILFVMGCYNNPHEHFTTELCTVSSPWECVRESDFLGYVHQSPAFERLAKQKCNKKSIKEQKKLTGLGHRAQLQGHD